MKSYTSLMIVLERNCGNCRYFDLHDKNWGVCNNPRIGVFHTAANRDPIEALVKAEDTRTLRRIASGEIGVCFKPYSEGDATISVEAQTTDKFS